MNRSVTIALVLAVLAGSPHVFAQNPAPNAGAAAPVIAPSQERARPPVEARRNAAMNADARRCLEFPTNLEVIKCAEKYFQRKRNR